MYYIIIQLIESVLPDIILYCFFYNTLVWLYIIVIRIYVSLTVAIVINACIVMPPQAAWLMSIHYDSYITLYCHMHYNAWIMSILYNDTTLQCSHILKSQWNVNTIYCQHNNLNPSNSFNGPEGR
jgi:hypothetical protein